MGPGQAAVVMLSLRAGVWAHDKLAACLLGPRCCVVFARGGLGAWQACSMRVGVALTVCTAGCAMQHGLLIVVSVWS
jgi:hypothetical protein